MSKIIPDITDHRGIIAAWKNSHALARDLDIAVARVGMWRTHNSIAPMFWSRLIEIGKTGYPKRKWITWELLMKTRPPRKGQI